MSLDLTAGKAAAAAISASTHELGNLCAKFTGTWDAMIATGKMTQAQVDSVTAMLEDGNAGFQNLIVVFQGLMTQIEAVQANL